MANEFASGKTKLVEPPYGSYVDEWENPLNSNAGVVDAGLSGTTTIDVSGASPSQPYLTLVFQTFDDTLTPWTAAFAGQNLRVNLTGHLAFDTTLYIPAGTQGFWLFANNTVNAYNMFINTNAAGATPIKIPQGRTSILYSDGTNVSWADDGNVIANVPQPVPSGTIVMYGGDTCPALYLPCDGSRYPKALYPLLFDAIGTTWGGSGTNFNVPNLQGAFARGWGDGINPNTRNVGTHEAAMLMSHNHPAHSVADPHSHSYLACRADVLPIGYFPGGPDGQPTNYGGTTDPFTVNITTTTDNTGAGGTNNVPENYAVMYIIRI
jgi:microcystin-dependent protein